MTEAFPGGRSAALAALARIRPSAYARSRNFLDGAVTRLSPYLRHGVLSLAEVRDAVLARGLPRRDVEKLVQELAWRDYYVRVRAAIGDGVWDDLEPYKTGFAANEYADALPDDVAAGTTGLACIDRFVADLRDTGYVHNHARMWFASYVVHWRRVRWQAGAAFYLALLLDGDPASNNLSWQWVASTFSHKPYVFNRGNLERYTRGTLCARCPLAAGGCPFEASYAALDARLFPRGAVPTGSVQPHAFGAAVDSRATPEVRGAAVLWQHEEALADTNPARMLVPDAPAVFVWDTEARRRDPWPERRVRFVEETLRELRLDATASGDAAAEVAAFAKAHGAAHVVAVAPVDPRLRAVAAQLARGAFTVTLVEPAPFVRLEKPADLRRFSRYWTRARSSAFEPTET